MKDSFLIVLLVLGFVVLLTMGLSVPWSLFILLFVIMMYLGLRYPNGLEDWDRSRKESAALLVTLASILLVIYLVYLVLGTVNFPDTILMITWASAIIIAVLFILSLFFPSGKKVEGLW
ncbi:MAG: hypothetical protein ACQESD_00315 [Thermoplasmatota archaeon]